MFPFQQEDRIVKARLREYEERQIKSEFSLAVSFSFGHEKDCHSI